MDYLLRGLLNIQKVFRRPHLHIFVLIGICKLLSCNGLMAQQLYRIEAQFSTKEMAEDSTASLSIGQVYYDLRKRKIIYKVQFPQKASWIYSDSLVHVHAPDTSYSQKSSPEIVEMSLFHQVLSQEFNTYTLPDSLFGKISVEREGDLIISTWRPLDALSEIMGDILVSKKGKLLHGVVYLEKSGAIRSKQLYMDYDYSGPIPFPKHMTQVLYGKHGKTYRETTFRKVRFNVHDKDGNYDYSGIH